MKTTSLLALAGSASAAIQGFNYGSTFTSGAAKAQSDFEAEFSRAQTLQGTSGWTSARLYTMIQAGTANTPISAIPAAISTKTGLLLGMWASAGQASFDNEIAALKSAISQYGTAFTDLIQGISVGSEDLYRITPTGIENMSGAGANPDDLVSYIKQVRAAISGTSASGKSIGHVDTWTAWTNSSNNAVISAVDWLGFDGYPYFQTVNSNGIENAQSLFQQSYDATVAAAQGKDVWVTETGWPVSGPNENQAVASVENAKTYWDEVACALIGKTNTFWYTLQDAAPTTPSPSFGLVGSDLSSAPLFDLSCPAGSSGASASSSMASSSAAAVTSSVASATAPGTTAASTTVSVVVTPGVESGSLSVATGDASVAQTITVTVTTHLPLESCPATCANTPTTMLTAASSQTATPPAPATSSATTPATPSGSNCPTNLNGAYQYPHLIVPVDSSKPTTAFGTSYNGTVSSTVSTIFNFDIPQSYSGETCSLVFLFPQLNQLETSSYSFNDKGGISVAQLSSPATQQTTYNSISSESNANYGSISSLQRGNGYVVNTFSCPAGQTVSYLFSGTGDISLNWFNDWNPSPLGAFITVC
ncbi:hypothetical protein AMS68_005782 [Peltaster fructicola]|uniref:Probable glucan endo-1,3-beta-glucosidase eglC n=1 Tax=Peltaster fructicola TaxID=286661 RepID=A0A6H0Y026_9PEZI|nr:hypothetical protein AMS68_005782 [Peltaster fructicola]